MKKLYLIASLNEGDTIYYAFNLAHDPYQSLAYGRVIFGRRNTMIVAAEIPLSIALGITEALTEENFNHLLDFGYTDVTEDLKGAIKLEKKIDLFKLITED